MGDFRSDLEPEVERTETLILKVVREVVPCAYLKRIGPINFNPPAWSCWIVTSTDAERDALANDAELNQRIADAAKAGFPPGSFTYESEETVARDYEGSWFYAMR
jgi:hypothetical protein